MSKSPWLFVFTVMVSGFFVVSQIYAVLPLMPDIAADYNVTSIQASLISTAFGIAYACGILFFGPLADKVDRMTLLLLGLVVLAGATIVAAFSTSYWSLFGARVAQGVAAASFPATALALVSVMVRREQQPFAISMMGFAFLTAAPLSPLIVAASGFSLSALMAWMALFYLVCAASIYASGYLKSQDVESIKVSAILSESEKVDRHMPPVGTLTIVPGTVLLCLVTFHSLCQMLAEHDTSIDPQFLRLVGIPPLLFCFLAPAITKRFGPAVTAFCGLVIASFGMALGGAGINLAFASVAVSAGVALAVPGLIAAVSFWSGEAVRARALAIYTFFLFVGASVAPVLASVLYQDSGTIGFSLPAFAALLAAGILYLTRPRHRASS